MDLFTADVNGQPVLRAMPLLLGVLCILAIAYRYYGAFLAAKVAMLDDLRRTLIVRGKRNRRIGSSPTRATSQKFATTR